MDSDVIVVNCGGDGEWLKSVLDSNDIVSVTQIDIPAARFNRSLALNIGIHAAAPGVIFLLDADVLLTENIRKYVEICAEQKCFGMFPQTTGIPEAEPSFVPSLPGSFLKTIISSSDTSFVWADGSATRIERTRSDLLSCRRLLPGLLLVHKQYLTGIGGFRSSFVGWGWDDTDVQLRLHRFGLQPIDVDVEVQHIDHGDDKRDLAGDSKDDVLRKNRERAFRSYSNGEFYGSLDVDLKAWWPLTTRATFVAKGKTTAIPGGKSIR